MMHVVLLGAGLAIVIMGLVLTGWAALDGVAGGDRSLLLAAMVALVGGLALLGLAAILMRLRRLVAVIENWPVPRGAAAQALRRAVDGLTPSLGTSPLPILRPPHVSAETAPEWDAGLATQGSDHRVPSTVLPDMQQSSPAPESSLPPLPTPAPTHARAPDFAADPTMHLGSDEGLDAIAARSLGGSALAQPTVPAAAPEPAAPAAPAFSAMPAGAQPIAHESEPIATPVLVPEPSWPRVDPADRLQAPEPVEVAPTSTEFFPPPVTTVAISSSAGGRTSWPELRAGERLAEPPSETVEAPAEIQVRPPDPTIIKSGVIEGMAYTIYSDGSLEAELPEGLMRFASIAEWRAHMRMSR